MSLRVHLSLSLYLSLSLSLFLCFSLSFSLSLPVCERVSDAIIIAKHLLAEGAGPGFRGRLAGNARCNGILKLDTAPGHYQSDNVYRAFCVVPSKIVDGWGQYQILKIWSSQKGLPSRVGRCYDCHGLTFLCSMPRCQVISSLVGS